MIDNFLDMEEIKERKSRSIMAGLRGLKDKLTVVGRTAPSEILLSLVFFVLCIVHGSVGFMAGDGTFLWPMAMMLLYGTNKLTVGTRFRWGYWLAAAVGTVALFLKLPSSVWSEKFTICFLSGYAVLGLYVMASHRRHSNRAFINRNVGMIFSMLLAAVLSSILGEVLGSIAAFTRFVFDLGFDTAYWFVSIQEFALTVVFTVLFFVFDRDEDEEFGDNTVVGILVNYIFSPALFIYAILLYVYFGGIVFRWKLPQGVVSSVSLAFLISSIILYELQAIMPRKRYGWFYGHITLWVFPAVIMVWIAALYRINEYGFTVARIYLAYSIIVTTIIYAVIAVCKTVKVRSILTALIGFVIVITYVPGIHPWQIEERSQLKMDEKRVAEWEKNIIDDNAKIDMSVPNMRQMENEALVERMYKCRVSMYDLPSVLDVSGYDKLYKVNDYYDTDPGGAAYFRGAYDGIVIVSKKRNPDTGESDTVFRIGYEELAEDLFRNAGLSRKVSVTKSEDITSAKERFTVYEAGGVKIIFFSISFDGIEGYRMNIRSGNSEGLWQIENVGINFIMVK